MDMSSLVWQQDTNMGPVWVVNKVFTGQRHHMATIAFWRYHKERLRPNNVKGDSEAVILNGVGHLGHRRRVTWNNTTMSGDTECHS